MQRGVPEIVGGRPRLVPGLRVQQVRSRDVGQRLGGTHVRGVQLAGSIPVEVERAQPAIAVAQGEREDRGQSCGNRGRRKQREPPVDGQVGNGDHVAGLEGQ